MAETDPSAALDSAMETIDRHSDEIADLRAVLRWIARDGYDGSRIPATLLPVWREATKDIPGCN